MEKGNFLLKKVKKKEDTMIVGLEGNGESGDISCFN